MDTRRRALGLLGAAGILMLAGCAQVDEGPFSGEQGPDDVLPAVVAQEGLRAESVRHLGDDSKGWQYFAAKFEQDGNRDLHCIVVVPDDSPDWVSGCSTEALPLSIGSSTATVTVVSRPPGDDAKGERVGDYLLVSRSGP